MSDGAEARAKTAVREVRDLGELDIKVLEDGRRAGAGAATGDSSGASDRPRPNRRHSTRRLLRVGGRAERRVDADAFV